MYFDFEHAGVSLYSELIAMLILITLVFFAGYEVGALKQSTRCDIDIDAHTPIGLSTGQVERFRARGSI